MYALGKENGVVCLDLAISPENCLLFIERMDRIESSELKRAIEFAGKKQIKVHLRNPKTLVGFAIQPGAVFIDTGATDQEILDFLLGK